MKRKNLKKQKHNMMPPNVWAVKQPKKNSKLFRMMKQSTRIRKLYRVPFLKRWPCVNTLEEMIEQKISLKYKLLFMLSGRIEVIE